MKLQQIRAELRPRNPWEAIDLGFLFVQQWPGPLFRLWLAWLLPPAVLLYWLLWDSPWLAAMTIWLLRPLFDLPLVVFFSRRLFGESPRFGETLRTVARGFFRQGLWYGWLLLRLSSERATSLPVWLLEGLRGKARRERLRLLGRGYNNKSVMLTQTCWLFDWALYLSLFFLLALFLPPQYDYDFGELLWAVLSHDVMAEDGLKVLIMVFNLTSFALLEPFYIASGFALYLNRRTHLEGWDIELQFRRLAQRSATRDKPNSNGLL